MKTLVGLLICTITVAACVSPKNTSTTYNPKGGTATYVRKWKPVKDKTSYLKTIKIAERD